MSDRVHPGRLWRGHLKVLTLRTSRESRPDLFTLGVVFFIPLALGVVAGVSGFKLVSPDALLAGLSLLTAGLIAAFAQIATWRARLTERADARDTSEASDRESLDEAATNVLMASLASVLGVLAIVIGQATTDDKGGALTGIACAAVVALGSYIAIVFALVVFKLYDAYTYINKVSDRLNGSVRS